MMRVLYYNWVDYKDPEGRGGGVSVYLRNLMRTIDRTAVDIEAGFFTSGLSYDLVASRTRWEVLSHGPNRDRPFHYDIVNAQPLAPAHHSFGEVTQLSHPPTENAVCDLVEATGPWDVIHFNNLEGLPLATLEALKIRFPGIKIVLSLHNYYPFCPQVNLWHQERVLCTDYRDGVACTHCVANRPDPRMVRIANAIAYRLKRNGAEPGGWVFDSVFLWLMRLGRRGAWLLRKQIRTPLQKKNGLQRLAPPDGRPFLTRRESMLAAINRHCDAVICVSKAVAEVAAAYGVARERMHTIYIGTDHAHIFNETATRKIPKGGDNVITLGYLGYMRRDKGFYFLLDALESLPSDLAKKFRLVVAARSGDRETMGRLAALAAHLFEIQHSDGYSHADLDSILEGVDIGVVPVLWHDNLPQVAIELHSRHIPLLCADRGGAQELSGSTELVFPAGDVMALHDRLFAIATGSISFDGYWRCAQAPRTLEQHIRELEVLYCMLIRSGARKQVSL